jgi:hypothetical protein
MFKKEMSFEAESNSEFTVIVPAYQFRGFKVFYNRRYFLNFRRYLKN